MRNVTRLKTNPILSITCSMGFWFTCSMGSKWPITFCVAVSLYLIMHRLFIVCSLFLVLKQFWWVGVLKFCLGFFFIDILTRFHSDLNYLNRVFRCGFSYSDLSEKKGRHQNRHFDIETDYRIKWHIHDNSEKKEHSSGYAHKEKTTATKQKCWISMNLCIFWNSNVSHKSHSSWTGPNKHLRNHFK